MVHMKANEKDDLIPHWEVVVGSGSVRVDARVQRQALFRVGQGYVRGWAVQGYLTKENASP